MGYKSLTEHYLDLVGLFQEAIISLLAPGLGVVRVADVKELVVEESNSVQSVTKRDDLLAQPTSLKI